MPPFIRAYVRYTDAVSIAVGKFAMYGIFAITGLLLYTTISRSIFDHPLIWGVEMGQFMFTAYFFLGGAYTMLLRGHVRMDLLYQSMAPKKQGLMDAIMDFCMIFYLIVMLIGGISSTSYALVYGQVKRSIWAPPMWPIKMIICFGIVLMLLQAFSTLFKDIAKARGLDIFDGAMDSDKSAAAAALEESGKNEL